MMKFYKALFFALALAIAGGSVAQDSQVILDKLSKKVKSYTTIYAEYELQIKDDQAGDITTQTGKATIKGEKFILEMDDYKIYCDATTVWTYEKETNTVYINDFAEMQEEQDMSLSDIFTIWENGYRHQHKGTVEDRGKKLTQINLFPTDSENQFHTIILMIDEAKMELVKATMKGRDGQTMVYKITKFTPNKEVEDKDFKFNKKNFPGVEEDDQR